MAHRIKSLLEALNFVCRTVKGVSCRTSVDYRGLSYLCDRKELILIEVASPTMCLNVEFLCQISFAEKTIENVQKLHTHTQSESRNIYGEGRIISSRLQIMPIFKLSTLLLWSFRRAIDAERTRHVCMPALRGKEGR